MPIRNVTLGAALLLAILNTSPARAQYLYMDSNGNGMHDSGDRMKKNGATTIDIYLTSNQNRDGSAAACNVDGSVSMQVFSYNLVFEAVGGTVSWNSFTNAVPGFRFFYSSAVTSPTVNHMFYASSAPETPWLEPGRHYLGRLVVTVASGSPALNFGAVTVPAGYVEYTSFGTPCPGLDYDNTYKLGSDFQDTDGLAGPGSPRPASSRVVVVPNPMNPTAKFAFETSRAGRVRARIFDVNGRLVRTLVDDSSMPAGRHELTIDGAHGRDMSSGVYFYRLESVDGAFTGRLTISR